MVPVSTRGEQQRDQLGNRISFAFVDLPVTSRAGRRGYARARRDVRVQALRPARRDGDRPRRARPAARSAEGPAARIAASPRVFNLTVSNVPGRGSLYMLGAELREAYPVVPVAEGHALSIGMFSYRDHMFFGLYSDPEALPDAERLPGLLNAEIRALARPRPAALAGADGSPPRPGTRQKALTAP